MFTPAAIDKAGKEFKVWVEIKGRQLLLTLGELWQAFEWFCQVWAVRKTKLTWGHLSDSETFAGRFRRLFYLPRKLLAAHLQWSRWISRDLEPWNFDLRCLNATIPNPKDGTDQHLNLPADHAHLWALILLKPKGREDKKGTVEASTTTILALTPKHQQVITNPRRSNHVHPTPQTLISRKLHPQKAIQAKFPYSSAPTPSP